MISLTVCNHKGGTGKTTTSINLSAALGLSGHRVLVVDLDPQGFLTRMMGVSEPDPAASVMVIFDPDRSPEEDLPTVGLSTFDLLPSSPALSSALRRLTRPTDVLWAKEFVEKGIRDYDIVLFDTAAAVTVYSLNALVASDHVVIPVLPEYQPVIGAEQTYQTAQMVRDKLNPGLSPPRFLFTMVDGSGIIGRTGPTFGSAMTIACFRALSGRVRPFRFRKETAGRYMSWIPRRGEPSIMQMPPMNCWVISAFTMGAVRMNRTNPERSPPIHDPLDSAGHSACGDYRGDVDSDSRRLSTWTHAGTLEWALPNGPGSPPPGIDYAASSEHGG